MKKIRRYEMLAATVFSMLPVLLIICWVLEGYDSHLYTIIGVLIMIIIELICYIRITDIKQQLRNKRRRVAR